MLVRSRCVKMLETEFTLDMSRVLADATDALGAAMCHYFQSRGALGGATNFSGWKGFLAANSKRVL